MTDRKREPKEDVKKQNNLGYEERNQTQQPQHTESEQSEAARDSIKANQEHLQDMTAGDFEDYDAAAEEYIDDGTLEQRKVISQEIPPSPTPLPQGYTESYKENESEGRSENQKEASRENVKKAQDAWKNMTPEERSESRSEGATEKQKEAARQNIKKAQEVRRSDQ